MPVPTLRAWRLGAALCSLCLLASPVSAQQAPQITPRDLRPEATAQPAPNIPTPAPQPVPDQAETLFVTPASVTLEGGFPELAASTDVLLAAVTGKRVSVARIYALGAAIEAFYNEAGFPLVRVTVPPQQLNDGGPLRLLVVDGFIERLELAALPERDRRQVAVLLHGLVGKPHVRQRELERVLMLAGRLPGLSLRSALAQGSVNGGVVLVLDGQHALAGGALSADNRLTDGLGPVQSNLQLGVNQLLGLGEQVYLYGASGADIHTAYRGSARRRVFGAGVSLPVGSDGVMLNAELTQSVSQPRAPLSSPVTLSRFDRASVRVSYPLILDRAQELSLTGAIDATKQIDTLPDFGYTLDTERLRALRLGASWHGAVGAFAQLGVGATVSQGLLGAGATTREDALASGIALSRPGARPDFRKLEMNLALDLTLPGSVGAKSVARWQRSLRGVLPGAELFSLDGEDALSSFKSGTLSADGGWIVRQELKRQFLVEAGGKRLGLSPYLFAAAGARANEIADAQADHLIRAYGVGLRSQWGPAALALEYGSGRLHATTGLDKTVFAKVQVQF